MVEVEAERLVLEEMGGGPDVPGSKLLRKQEEAKGHPFVQGKKMSKEMS